MNTYSPAFMRTVVVLSLFAACERIAGNNTNHEKAEPPTFVDESRSDERPVEADATEVLLPSIRIPYKDLRPELQELITNLKAKNIRQLTSSVKQFVILKPGPGLYPAVGYGKGEKDLLGLEEIYELMDFQSFDSTYRLLPDRCTVLEAFPDGIYVRETDAEHLQIPVSADDVSASVKLTGVLKEWTNKKGIELLLKFTPTEEPLFLDFFFYEEDGQLRIAIIDQRTCGP